MKNIQFLLFILLAAIPAAISQASVDYNAGYTEIDSAILDNIVISGMGTTVQLVDGGSVTGDIRVEQGHYASFFMTGGSIGGDLYALGALPMFIKGGTIAGNISVGSPSELGDIYIHGNNFMIDGQPVAYGISIQQNGQLTGTLENGDAIDTTVSFSGSNGIVLVEVSQVPEPASLVLLTLGAFCLRRKK